MELFFFSLGDAFELEKDVFLNNYAVAQASAVGPSTEVSAFAEATISSASSYSSSVATDWDFG